MGFFICTICSVPFWGVPLPVPPRLPAGLFGVIVPDFGLDGFLALPFELPFELPFAEPGGVFFGDLVLSW